MTIRQQLNVVLQIDKNNIDDLNMLNQMVLEGWKIIHMGELSEEEKAKESILKNSDFKVILFRIFK
jgi:hypothetical protein